MGFGLVIGFINYSQVVNTIKYITVNDFYTTNHSTLIFSVCLYMSSLSVSWQRVSTQELSQTHTSNITHEEILPLALNVFNSQDQIFSSYEPYAAVSLLEQIYNYSRTSISLS
jgi:hypothetical protein